MSRKKTISTIYFKNVLVREISIPINKIGSNLKNIIKAKLANNLEGKCSKEGYLKKIINFNIDEGLIVVDINGRNRLFEEIENWTGKRGQAGKKVPKGFPRNF